MDDELKVIDTPNSTVENLQGGSSSASIVTPAATSPAVPAISGGTNSKDLSGIYANVGGTIYNTQTNQAYSSAADFFKASGQSSFQGLKFNTNYKPPTGFNETQNKLKQQFSGATLTEEQLNNGSTMRGLANPTLAGQTFKMSDGSSYDSTGKQLTPPTAQNQSTEGASVQSGPQQPVGTGLPPNLAALIPSNAAYDDQQAFANILKSANDYITKLTDPAAQTSLVNTYNDARGSVGLPAIDDEINSVQTAMQSTPDDITAELKSRGAMVDQSDVEYLSSIRDKALNDRLTTLTNLKNTQQAYVDQVVSLTGQDQQQTLQNFQQAYDVAGQLQQTQATMNATGATNRMNAINFAQSNNIKQPFYSVGGTVYNTSTGFAYSNPQQAAAAGVDTTGWSNVQQLAGAGQNPSNLIKVTLPDGSSGLYNAQTGQIIDPGQAQGSNLTSGPGTVTSPNGQYDLSTYASSPGYSDRVQSIANTINSSTSSGSINTAADAQSYIDSNYPTSPVTGDMVMNAAQQYNVDPSVIMAIMQKESQMGTDKSKGATENNFGNVGNTDSLMASGGSVPFSNPQDGVNAIAKNLQGRKITSQSSSNISSAAQSWVNDIINNKATIANVPAALKTQVAEGLNNTPANEIPALAGSRLTMESNRIVSNYIQLPQYQLTAQGLPYLQRIQAAMKTPGSISDQDLLDSLTKLNTAGNAISDEQVKIITDGQTYADWANVVSNKLSTGGVLSNSQRQQISTIANNIYSNYQAGYQPVYNQAASQLEAAGIPKAYWTIPDLNNLSSQVSGTQGTPNDPYAPTVNLEPDAVSTLDSLVP